MQENLTKKLYTLIDLSSLLGHQSDFQEILRLIAQKSVDLVSADISLIMMRQGLRILD